MNSIKARLQYKAFIYVNHFYPNGITLDRHTSLKRYLFDTMIYCKKESLEKKKVVETYQFEVEFLVKDWIFTERGFKGLYANANVAINDQLVDRFDDMFFDFMNKNMIRKNRVHTAILLFQLKYKIDEGYLSHETLKKAYYRYRQKDDLFLDETKKMSRKGYNQLEIFPNMCPEAVQGNRVVFSPINRQL